MARVTDVSIVDGSLGQGESITVQWTFGDQTGFSSDKNVLGVGAANGSVCFGAILYRPSIKKGDVLTIDGQIPHDFSGNVVTTWNVNTPSWARENPCSVITDRKKHGANPSLLVNREVELGRITNYSESNVTIDSCNLTADVIGSTAFFDWDATVMNSNSQDVAVILAGQIAGSRDIIFPEIVVRGFSSTQIDHDFTVSDSENSDLTHLIGGEHETDLRTKRIERL